MIDIETRVRQAMQAEAERARPEQLRPIIVNPMERMLGKPILTANQLTMWACLGRMDLPMMGPGRWLRDVFSGVER